MAETENHDTTSPSAVADQPKDNAPSNMEKPSESEESKPHQMSKQDKIKEKVARQKQKPHQMSKQDKIKEKVAKQKQKAKDKANPPGGYDATPIPSAPDGYTIRFTFVRAESLPVADLTTGSADPFIHATLAAPLQKRHREDPDMILRTRTIHKSTNPEWNQEWIVAGVPSWGFKLKCRIFDEDSADHDDRLGNVTVIQTSINENWAGFKEASFDIKKRMGSWRAYLTQGVASMCSSDISYGGKLILSAEVLGKSDPPYGRMYTLGPIAWTKHFSPMIGRIAGTRAPDVHGGEETGEKAKTEKYDFQANQIQLSGPVPPELYHRFVEFKPFVKGMFDKAGLRGRVLNAALHHQHARIYNYSNTTKYGVVEPKSEEAALQFLKMAHFDEGGRLFTYVLTLDGLLRFTETGKEFGIDLLSKHTMHSDVNIYIACSGEFFIRKLQNPEKLPEDPDQHTHPAEDLLGGLPETALPKKAADYELVIDNDSGTYRPNGKKLPELEKFLDVNFPGLHVVTKQCTDENLQKMKKEQREFKKKQGQNIQVLQISDDEMSSSDEEEMDNMISGKTRMSKHARVYEALEDPETALKTLLQGERQRKLREGREEEENMAEGSTS